MTSANGLKPASAWISLGIVLLLAMSASAPQAPAQTPQQAPIKPLQYEVSVVLKLIHVYVTDKKGNPVPDLVASDFSVTDNGEEMKVTDFEKRGIQAPAAPSEMAESVPNPEVAATAAPVARQTGRKFFFFFDFSFNNARGLVKARTAALHFLETSVRADDEVGILTYSMLKGLRVHEYLTKDLAKVREVVEAIGSKDIAGRAGEMETLYWQLVEDPPPGAQRGSGENDQGGPDKGVSVSPYAYEAMSQREEAKKLARNYIAKLTDLAKSMRFVEGQKHFILFSSGLPTSLVYGAQGGNPSQSSSARIWGGSQFDIGDSVLKPLNEAMTQEFAASGCRFFAFDTRETAKGIDLFSYDSRTLETGARGSVFGKDAVFNDSSSVIKDERGTGLDYLKLLTDRTGGKYYSNINRYEKNLEQVQNLTGTYYVLGYPINERWDGKFHQVKVEVNRKGCEVRAQSGYFSPKPFGEYSDLEKQLHLFDLALNERALSRMPDRVPMSAFSSSAEGITRLAVLARLPGEVTAKFSGKRLEFVVLFFDGKGEIGDMVREVVDPGPLRGRDTAFAAGTSLKPGDYSCRLVIRDMESGLSAVGSTKANVAKPQIGALELGTPLVLEARTGCGLLHPVSRRAKAFLWSEVYPYDSSLYAPVLSDPLGAAAGIQVVIPCANPGGGTSDLAVTAAFVNAATGERSPVAISAMNRAPQGPLEILTLEIPTAAIPAGTYYLHFYAQDRATGALGHLFTTLVVAPR